jgi:hypothetical protein
MAKYHSLSELMWAKIALTCKSQPVSVYADRKTFDDLLAANRIVAHDILSGASVTAAEILWLSEKLTWIQYCELGYLNLLGQCHIKCFGCLKEATCDQSLHISQNQNCWLTIMAVGILKPFPGVNPRNDLAGVYHSLAELMWAKAEMEFQGDAVKLKQNYNVFQMLRQANLATVKKNCTSDRGTDWQLYQSEVHLWAGFGTCQYFRHQRGLY